MVTQHVTSKEPKDLRYRRQFFPDGDKLVFDTGKRGFVPLPITLRKLLPHLSAAELRVLIYLHLRASRYGICYPTIEEMVHELGLTTRKNLMPHLDSLVEKKCISTHTAAGRRYFLVHDPRVPLEHLARTGKLSEAEAAEIADLYTDLGQSPPDVLQKSIDAAPERFVEI